MNRNCTRHSPQIHSDCYILFRNVFGKISLYDCYDETNHNMTDLSLLWKPFSEFVWGPTNLQHQSSSLVSSIRLPADFSQPSLHLALFHLQVYIYRASVHQEITLSYICFGFRMTSVMHITLSKARQMQSGWGHDHIAICCHQTGFKIVSYPRFYLFLSLFFLYVLSHVLSWWSNFCLSKVLCK